MARSPQGRVLMVKRTDTGDWAFPGGKIKTGEFDSESVITGIGNAHHAGTPQSSEPHVSSVTFTLKIEHQDGRRFWGVVSSERSTDSLIGVISRNGSIYYDDAKGYGTATLLSPERLEMCYLQIASTGRVASCTEMTKEP